MQQVCWYKKRRADMEMHEVQNYNLSVLQSHCEQESLLGTFCGKFLQRKRPLGQDEL